MRVCQFRHFGTLKREALNAATTLIGHAFPSGLQLDCNTQVWFVDLMAVEDGDTIFGRSKRLQSAN
jgi:hypothetical protein